MTSLPAFKKYLLATILGVITIGMVSTAYAQEEAAPVVSPDTTQVEEAAETPAPFVENLPEITEEVTDPNVVTLTAIPPRLGDDGSLTGDPGTAIQTQVRVRNNTDQAVLVESIVEDFIIGEDGKTPVPITTETDSMWSLAQWITLASPRNSVPAHGTASIPVIIQVPDNAKPGGRYAMITHQPVSGTGQSQTGDVAGSAAITPRVGTLVYFRVNGDVTQNAVLRNINIPGLSEYGPIPISFEIENLSDIHVQPHTTITVKNMLGQRVDEFEVRSQNIFPYTTRAFTTEWDRVWGFGRYTAEFVTTYGDQGKLATAEYSFWLVPYTLIMAILFILLALTGIVVAVRRHLNHRNSVEQQHISLLEDRIRQLEEELQRPN